MGDRALADLYSLAEKFPRKAETKKKVGFALGD
jgi:hypothetical protein